MEVRVMPGKLLPAGTEVGAPCRLSGVCFLQALRWVCRAEAGKEHTWKLWPGCQVMARDGATKEKLACLFELCVVDWAG